MRFFIDYNRLVFRHSREEYLRISWKCRASKLASHGQFLAAKGQYWVGQGMGRGIPFFQPVTVTDAGFAASLTPN